MYCTVQHSTAIRHWPSVPLLPTVVRTNHRPMRQAKGSRITRRRRATGAIARQGVADQHSVLQRTIGCEAEPPL